MKKNQRDGERRCGGEGKAEAGIKTWKLEQTEVLSPKRPTQTEKRSKGWPRERPGWATVRSQWERHLPPNGSSGMWGSVGRTHGSRASSLQPREGLSRGVGVTQGRPGPSGGHLCRHQVPPLPPRPALTRPPPRGLRKKQPETTQFPRLETALN